jgi:hypothetical protein
MRFSAGSRYIRYMAALIDTPEAANRLARAIASDLSLYNEAKIKEGIENDTFFSVLQEEIAEGRAHYESRVDPKILGSSNFFDRALVDVILARKGHIKSKIW